MYLKENCFKVLTIFEKITKPKNGCKINMAIAWDLVIIENTLLAAIIVGSIYLERWLEEKARLHKETETKKKLLSSLLVI
jgi:hypothetical protein